MGKKKPIQKSNYLESIREKIEKKHLNYKTVIHRMAFSLWKDSIVFVFIGTIIQFDQTASLKRMHRHRVGETNKIIKVFG